MHQPITRHSGVTATIEWLGSGNTDTSTRWSD